MWTTFRRHKEISNLLGELCTKSLGNATIELIINEDVPFLRSELAVRDVWKAQRAALFDVRVAIADAPSCVS